MDVHHTFDNMPTCIWLLSFLSFWTLLNLYRIDLKEFDLRMFRPIHSWPFFKGKDAMINTMLIKTQVLL